MFIGYEIGGKGYCGVRFIELCGGIYAILSLIRWRFGAFALFCFVVVRF